MAKRPAGAKPPPLRGIELETERFRIRRLSVVDLDETWDEWGRDEEAMALYNQRSPGEAARDAFARTIISANGSTQFVPGVFDKTGAPVGYFVVKLDPQTRNATFEYFFGARDWWGKGAVLEVRGALLSYFFAQRGVEKALGYPYSRNFPSIFNYLAQGWTQEGVLRAQVPAANGDGRLDQHVFSILKDEWDIPARKRRRADG